MIYSSLVKSCIMRSLVYFLVTFYDELIPLQKKKKKVCVTIFSLFKRSIPTY